MPLWNAKDIELCDWVEMITMETLPFSKVENDFFYQKKFRHKFNFKRKTVCEVLVAMMVLIEKKLCLMR